MFADMDKMILSARYRKMVGRAVLSISFFFLTYLMLLVLAVGLAVLCGYLAVMMVMSKVHWITIALGGGVFCMGLLIVYFVVKFIFSKSEARDFAGMPELSRGEQPVLFAMIDEIVEKTGTRRPKKIVVSPQVNASVFYDSSFWSMILPVSKNLHIGLGLMNSVTVSEFKAILAHEFGHFSQRSMKVGSFVYNMNKVIYDMLYDNDGYQNAARKIAGISWHFAIFVHVGLKITEGIQWILRKVYGIMNKSYMALSREMEFHADQVAARIAGPSAIIDSLYRLELSDYAYDETIAFYNRKIAENVKTENIFPDHLEVMKCLAEEAAISFRNELPHVTRDDRNRYDKSRLVLTSQYESHPDTADRAAVVMSYNIAPVPTDDRMANILFHNLDGWQRRMTSDMFEDVEYAEVPAALDASAFRSLYREYRRELQVHPVFNGYYDARDFVSFEESGTPQDPISSPAVFFSDEIVEATRNLAALRRDIDTLKSIAVGETEVETFDYDGRKYSGKDASSLVPLLEADATQLDTRLQENDKAIFCWFRERSRVLAEESGFMSRVATHREFQALIGTFFEHHDTLRSQMAFFFDTTSYEEIRKRLNVMASGERELREDMEALLNHPRTTVLSEDTRKAFRDYIGLKDSYFTGESYNNEATAALFAAVDSFPGAVLSIANATKRELLLFMGRVSELQAAEDAPALI